MTTPAKPKVLHVYREYSEKARYAAFESPIMVAQSMTQFREHLGEYAPRGPVVAERWEVRTKRADGSVSSVYRCSSERSAREESKELHFARRVAGFKKTKHYIVHITTRKVCR